MQRERFGRGGPFPSAAAEEGFSSVMLRRFGKMAVLEWRRGVQNPAEHHKQANL